MQPRYIAEFFMFVNVSNWPNGLSLFSDRYSKMPR